MKRVWLFAVLCLLLALSGCMGVKPEDKQPLLILRYADNQPEDYPTTLAAEYFAQQVEARTHGKIRIRVYSDGELGEENSVQEQLRFGGIDVARVSCATLAEEIPEITTLTLPFLYKDAEHMWRVLDGPIGDEFLLRVRSSGLVGLSWYDAGARSFYTRKPITRLSDLQGMIIRVQESSIMRRTVELLGAVPVQIPYGDVYSAIKTSRVGGAENNLPSYAMTGHCEAAPYFLEDEHSRLPEIQVMSAVAMDRIAEIDPDYVTIVMACAKESALYERELWEEQVSASKNAALDRGCTITKLDPEEREKFRQAVQPIYDALSQKDQKAVREIQEYQ